MNVVRDRPEARWLPSRHHFALARLVAYAMLGARLRAAAEPAAETAALHLILTIDRHQSALENYTVTVWFMAAMTCFVAAALPLAMPWALLVAFPLAVVGVELPVYAVGFFVPDARVPSMFLMLCGIAAALYFASQPAWARYPAYAFLGVIAVNALAAAVMWLLRGRVCELERQCGA